MQHVALARRPQALWLIDLRIAPCAGTSVAASNDDDEAIVDKWIENRHHHTVEKT